LNHFIHDYSANLSSWEGQYIFTELETENLRQKNAWNKKRKEIFSVSISNFIRSLYHNSTLENGFLLTYRKQGLQGVQIADPELLFLTTNAVGDKTLHIPFDMGVTLFCLGKPVRNVDMQKIQGVTPLHSIGIIRIQILTQGDPVRIFPDGTYMNPLWASPVYSSKPFSGLDMILPIDYNPEGENGYTETKKEPAKIVPALPPLTDNLIRVAQSFERQLSVFPQEKIHLHTDKPYYLSGERIWFRAHVVDAASHIPSFSSGSLYVELFDARDSVICRVKTGYTNDLYSGYIKIPENAPEGDYTLRAYNARMRNLDEDYFFINNIRIVNPMTRILQTKPEFEFLPDQKIGASIRFSPSSTSSLISPISPESVKISINNEKPMILKSENGLSSFSFKLSPQVKQRVMMLNAMYEKSPFQQYIRIPLPDDDFEVSFYPEGGSALYGCRGRVAVKAMQRDGTEMVVNGTIYDRQGSEITQFVTESRGMGQFDLMPERGETYYAVCTNSKGQFKRFDLPAPKENGYALSASWFRDRLILTYTRPNRKKRETRCV